MAVACGHAAISFLLRQWQCVKKGLHGGLAKAPVALMGSPMAVVDQPGIEIGLQWVGLTRSTHDRRPAGFGATEPSRVASPNAHCCPQAAIADGRWQRLSRV